MRINGLWCLCDDGVTRPIIRGRLEAADGTRKWAEFLVDVGADRTVLNAATVEETGLTARKAEEAVSGLGGVFGSISDPWHRDEEGDIGAGTELTFCTDE
jgi:hypothetical protein